MVADKKIIGLCVNNINDEYVIELVDGIYSKIKNTQYKLMVFSGGMNLYSSKSPIMGNVALYNNINYDIVDMLIIVENRFFQDETENAIIDRAHANNIPVVVVNGNRDKCYNITSNGVNALKKIIEDVIVNKNKRNLYFVAGILGERENDIRLNVFKEVCENHGIQINNENIGCGEYWEKPTEKLITSLIKNNRVPQAFICANDAMAIETIRVLNAHGYKVPEDVLVTGYDGVVISQLYSPSITTCKEDISSLVDKCIRILDEVSIKGVNPHNTQVECIPIMGESSGNVVAVDAYDAKLRNFELYQAIYDIHRHENEVYNWAETALYSDNFDRFKATLSAHLVNNSCVYLKEDYSVTNDFCEDLLKGAAYGESFTLFAHKGQFDEKVVDKGFAADKMVPDLDEWIKDDTVYILNAIYIDEKPLGIYACRVTNTRFGTSAINRIAIFLNLIFKSISYKKNHMIALDDIKNSKNTNPISKLANLKGFNSWFNDFSSKRENHKRAISMSIYNVKRYKYILENYGMEDIEEIIYSVARAFRGSVEPNNSYIAQITEDDFAVFLYTDIDAEDKDQKIQDMITESANAFYDLMGGINKANGKPYAIEVNAGATWESAGWNDKLNTYIKLANGNLYLNRLKYGSEAIIEETKDSTINVDEAQKRDMQMRFNMLLDGNLFTYFFQPLVDAHTGEIYAYEALMRTTKEIGLFPLDILQLATENKKLYAIEYATFFNIFERLQQDYEKFEGRKIFINTIPGNFLLESDLNLLVEKYNKYMSSCVIELTEGESVNDKELMMMKNLTDESIGCMLAVDDYGTGHSNIVNVLRYKPHVIKIDRYLITNIQDDNNKQMFVKNAIEFAKANDIKVVAEGVETLDELNMVIGLGADLIQGYYTAKPAPEPIKTIPEEIKKQIVNAYKNSLEDNVEEL